MEGVQNKLFKEDMKYFITLLMAVLLVYPLTGHAQQRGKQAGYVKAGYEIIVMPKLESMWVEIDDDQEEPNEPNIGAVDFHRLPDVNGIQGRVDRLINGITRDIPPEYDHYGYEIRRYMASVGNIKVYEDEEFIKQQIKNVRKAAVIADFWRESLEKEIAAIEKINGR